MTFRSVSVEDIKTSGGPEVVNGSQIELLYKLALSRDDLISDRCIESTYSPDISLTVEVQPTELLQGVYDGLLGMRAGGSVRRITIPSQLAYGSKGYGSVPPDTDLFLEVCVVSIRPNGWKDYRPSSNPGESPDEGANAI